MDKFKDIEAIRKDCTTYSQKEWADIIGSTFRSYHGRFNGEQPRWRLDEVIKASLYNDGYVKVHVKGKDYDILIKESVD